MMGFVVDKPLLLLNTEQSVAGISQAGDNITLLVQFAIDCGGENWEPRVMFADAPDSFRSGDEIHQSYVPAA